MSPSGAILRLFSRLIWALRKPYFWGNGINENLESHIAGIHRSLPVVKSGMKPFR